MSETYPRKTLCETLFAGHTPSSVGFGCKGSEKFAYLQIFQLKVYSLRFKGGDYVAVQWTLAKRAIVYRLKVKG